MAFRHKVTTLAAALGMMAVASSPALASDVSERAGADAGWGSAGYRNSAIASAVVGFLGMSEAELAEAGERGKSLAELAADRGVDIDVLVTALLRTRREATERAVVTGKLSRSQANAIIERVADKLGERVTDPLSPALSAEPTSRADLYDVRVLEFPRRGEADPGGGEDFPPAA